MLGATEQPLIRVWDKCNLTGSNTPGSHEGETCLSDLSEHLGDINEATDTGGYN